MPQITFSPWIINTGTVVTYCRKLCSYLFNESFSRCEASSSSNRNVNPSFHDVTKGLHRCVGNSLLRRKERTIQVDGYSLNMMSVIHTREYGEESEDLQLSAIAIMCIGTYPNWIFATQIKDRYINSKAKQEKT